MTTFKDAQNQAKQIKNAKRGGYTPTIAKDVNKRKAAENMSNDHVPAGATHTEADGTYWKEIDGEWYFYLALFGWKPYIGLKMRRSTAS